MSRRFSSSRKVRRHKNQERRLTTRPLRAEQLEPRAMMSASDPLSVVSEAPGAYGQTVISQTSIFGANADTMVQSWSPYRNFGCDSALVVSRNTVYRHESQAVLRFDMRSIAETPTSATLTLTRLWSSYTNPLTVFNVRLAGDGADYWTEGTNGYNFWRSGAMTWANRVQGAGLTVAIAASQWSLSNTFSLDVTSLVNQAYWNGNGIATFVIDSMIWGGGNASIAFASREHAVAGWRPTLTVNNTTIINDPPTVVSAAAAAESTVTGTGTVLSVLGDDDLGESNLRYTWSATTLPSGAAAPTFSVNGTNVAKTTTVSFSKAGTYVLTARISDASNAFVTSSVTVMVDQTFTSVLVSPGSATLSLGAAKQFTASARDQFGNVMEEAYTFDWSASDGSITGAGLLTAPMTEGSVIVTAAVGPVEGTANVTVMDYHFLGLNDGALASLTQSLYVDGSISRLDMIQILRSVGSDDSVVDAAELADLRTILSNATTLGIASYVQVLAGDVVNGNRANAYFQGTTLGNLYAGSSATQLNHLVDKWFLGADHPGDAGLNYVSANGSLFVGGPSHYDMYQGALGDCYFIASLGSVADTSAAAIENMFLDNGDNTWTVRFYVNGTADYVTVDRMLPVSASGRFVFANYGYYASSASNELWIALAEKAYAQWNETGNEGRDGQNLYSSIEYGWMADVYSQVLGKTAYSCVTSYNPNSTGMANAVMTGWAVTIGTISSGYLSYGLYGNHAYDVVSYNSSTGQYTLYNPWGSHQPTQSLTWAQLQTVCDWFALVNPTGTTPINPVGASQGGTLWSSRGAVDQLYLERGATPRAGGDSWAGGFHGFGSGADDESALAVNLLLQHVS